MLTPNLAALTLHLSPGGSAAAAVWSRHVSEGAEEVNSLR